MRHSLPRGGAIDQGVATVSGYMRSGVATPSSSRPLTSVRRVSAHRASRDAFVASSGAFSTRQFS